MKNLWEVWQGALSADYCDYIIESASKLPSVQAVVGFDPSAKPTNYRSSTIKWLDVAGVHADIAQQLMYFIKKSNRNNFGFDITEMNEIQFTEYQGTAKGKYDWHHDVDFEQPAPFDRKLSIVVQLSEPTDYQGGEFEFMGMPSPHELFRTRGSVLIFPSFFMHRVLPVLEGTRYSLVSWIEGPKWR